MENVKKIFYMIRVLPILPGVKWNDELFKKDLYRWKEILHIELSDKIAFAQILWKFPEFRNLFIYRNRLRRFYRFWIALWYKPMNTLFIQAKEIGGGLFIQHGFSTMIAAERIGENCWINQQVTIGFKDQTQAPIIENYVTITCGAKVLGNITVGNNSIIGANAVVIKDVEPNSIMAGVPAQMIRKNL